MGAVEGGRPSREDLFLSGNSRGIPCGKAFFVESFTVLFKSGPTGSVHTDWIVDVWCAKKRISEESKHWQVAG